MAVVKTTVSGRAQSGVTLHVSAPDGNHIVLHQPAGTAVLRIGTIANYVDLSPANVADLLPALTAFSLTGVLS